ncbi:alpha/beta-hydrolase [Trametes gibbosa]|nr:alpha/beta-hydrolase [Trametes gibbosa]
MAFAFSSPPLKALYLLVTVPVLLFVRLPFWVFTSAVPALRPRRPWSFKRALLSRVLSGATGIMYSIGLPKPEGNPDKDSLNPDATGFVWVDPVPSELIVGEIAEYARRNEVAPVRVYGYWYGTKDESGKHGQRAAKDERVYYHLHGGGHVSGSGHPASNVANTVKGFLEKCPHVFERAFALDYRISSSAPFPAANPFPASIIDAVSGYYYLVETLGFAPSNIIVCGDSAGGHLANNLGRYLVTANLPNLAPPGALILLSPTMDWANTHLGTPGSTLDANKSSDFVRVVLLSGYTPRSLLGNLDAGETATNAWLSPGSLKLPRPDGLFANYPPTFILTGSAEQTLDGMRTFRDRLVHDSGEVKVKYVEYPDMFHNFLMLGKMTEPERSEAYADMDKWLRAIYDL